MHNLSTGNSEAPREKTAPGNRDGRSLIFGWDNDSGNQVRQHPGACPERKQGKPKAHERRVEVEIFSYAASYPANHAVIDTAVQPFWFHN